MKSKTIRNFTLKSILDKDLNIDVSSPKSKWYDFLYPGKSIIKKIKSKVILTGSRALDCYTINDKKIINRKPNDWDFEITQKGFDKLCYDGIINIKDIVKSKKYHIYNIITKRWKSYDGYSGHVDRFSTKMDFIITDDVCDFIEVDGWKIATINHVFNKQTSLGKNTDIDFFDNKFSYICNYD